jgi:hypothetical protein
MTPGCDLDYARDEKAYHTWFPLKLIVSSSEMSVSPRRPSNMDPEWPSWTRASSDKSPVLPGPSSSRRPALLSRTTSAPAGGLYRLDDWNSAANTVNGANQMFIESRSPGLGWEKVRPKKVSHSNDEVRFAVFGTHVQFIPEEMGGNQRWPHVVAAQVVQSKLEPRLFSIAVVGTRGVGKSTFIQCALDLKRLPDSRSSTKRMCFGGAIYAVSLLEIATQETSLNGDRRIVWPRSVGDKQLPILDGALVLYDATNPNSVLESSRLISKCDWTSYPIWPAFSQTESSSLRILLVGGDPQKRAGTREIPCFSCCC